MNFKWAMPSAHINNRCIPMAAVQGDDRLGGKGNPESVRRIKAGTGNVQDSISGFLNTVKSPERVLRIGNGLRHLVCPEFYAAPMRGHYGDTGSPVFHVNSVIFTQGFMLYKFGKTAVSIQCNRLSIGIFNWLIAD